jgi:Putative porin
MKKVTLAAAALCVALGGTVARAQDAGALLDLLVKKRLISDQEAEEVRSELVKESASTAAGKWKLSTPITEIELYGDVRLRYEYRGGRLPSNNQGDFGQDHLNDWYERHRERYRLRVGLRGTLADDWFFGLRLETSNNPRSTNVTFGADSPGPFGKSDDGIFVGQAYFGYTGFPDFKLTGGKMPQPLITTSMLWDDDINPEGLAEQWKHTFTFDLGGGGGEAVQSYSKGGYSKEGKSVVAAPAEPFKLKLDVFANFAQYVYDDENPENPIGPNPTTTANNGSPQKIPTTDAFMLAWQVGARLTFPSSIYVQLAPTLYNYTGNGDTFNIYYNGNPGGNQTGINSLLVFDLPAEIGWKAWGLPMRVFGEFADNIEGHDRAHAAGEFDHTGQHYAWMIGGAIGQLKAKNDWEIRAWYQYAQQFALDPNLVDSDIFDSRINEKGVAIKAGYMVADSISLNLTWAYSWRINGSLGTGGSGDIPINPLDQYQIFQADMSVKF